MKNRKIKADLNEDDIETPLNEDIELDSMNTEYSSEADGFS